MRRLRLNSSIENVWSGARIACTDRHSVSCASSANAYITPAWMRNDVAYNVPVYGEYQRLCHRDARHCLSTYNEYQYLRRREAIRYLSTYDEYKRLRCIDAVRVASIQIEKKRPLDERSGKSKPVRLGIITLLLCFMTSWNASYTQTVALITKQPTKGLLVQNVKAQSFLKTKSLDADAKRYNTLLQSIQIPLLTTQTNSRPMQIPLLMTQMFLRPTQLSLLPAQTSLLPTQIHLPSVQTLSRPIQIPSLSTQMFLLSMQMFLSSMQMFLRPIQIPLSSMQMFPHI